MSVISLVVIITTVLVVNASIITEDPPLCALLDAATQCENIEISKLCTKLCTKAEDSTLCILLDPATQCHNAEIAKICPNLCKPVLSKVNGSWGSWESWSSCSKSCGGGTKQRHRYCDDPKPANGGMFCPGSSNSEDSCNTNACPIDGGIYIQGDPERTGRIKRRDIHVCGKANGLSKIVGGKETEVNEYPWQVALVNPGSNYVFCGGSLINDLWVLTAAHCTEGKGVKQVLLGNHLWFQTDAAEKRVNVELVVEHPNFDSGNLDNDFSLLKLATRLDLDSIAPGIRPVCLPSAINPEQYEDVLAVVSGWGTTFYGGSHSNVLQDVSVKTMNNSQCNQPYGGVILSSMICAASSGKDACRGDSGGPLVRNVGGYFNQIGVVSWGTGCASSYFPGVYSRVTSAIEWINSVSSSRTVQFQVKTLTPGFFGDGQMYA